MSSTPSTPEQDNAGSRRWQALPIVIVLLLFVGITGVFLIEALSYVTADTSGIEEPSATAYVARVEPLLVSADPARGEALIQQYECYACHIIGADNHLAPGFAGLGERAAERRPPLTAEAYLYEAILYPAVHEVEGYGGNMPQDYERRLSDDELGDIIAYLLTQ